MKDVPGKDFVIGSPAMPHLQYKKMVANTILLPKLKDRIKQLENQVQQLSR
jgi:UDP-3-O-[3-hydroxymyristoyl] glucosamine N-acyltransferase